MASGSCPLCQRPYALSFSCSLSYSLLGMRSFSFLDCLPFGIECLQVDPLSFGTWVSCVPPPCPPCTSHQPSELTRSTRNGEGKRLRQRNVLGHCLFDPPHKPVHSCIYVFAIFVVSGQLIQLPCPQRQRGLVCFPPQGLGDMGVDGSRKQE